MVDAPPSRPPPTDKDVLLSMRDLRAGFPTDDGFVRRRRRVVRRARGEVLAIVGESGSGKSVTAMAILGLQPTLEVAEGEILWKGTDLLRARGRAPAVRGKEIAMIFQDPLTAEPGAHRGPPDRRDGPHPRGHQQEAGSSGRSRCSTWSASPSPASGPACTRTSSRAACGSGAMIAMAITCKPDLLIADEPTTALDVTVQAQVLEVLVDIKDEIDSAIILITHDLGVVAGLAHRVMVMYAGRPIEMGTTAEIFYETRHPYTRWACWPACPASTTWATSPWCRSSARRRR